MSSDKEQNNQLIVPSGNPRLARYSSDLIKRGLDLAKKLDRAKAALEVQRQRIPVKPDNPNLQKWKCVHTFTGHSNLVTDLAISLDGQILASSSLDRTIKLWHLPTRKLVHTLTGHSDLVYSVAISPNGQILVSGSKDNTIKIWHLRAGRLLRTLSEDSGSVYAVDISPDGQILVSGSHGVIDLWNLNTGEWLYSLFNKYSANDSFLSVIFSPDGKTLASRSSGEVGHVQIWHLATSRALYTYPGELSSLSISPDGRTFACEKYEDGRKIELYNFPTENFLHTLTGYSDKALYAYWTNRVKMHPALRTFIGHEDSVLSVAFSPDGQTLASGSYDETIKIWNLRTGKLLDTLSGHLTDSGHSNGVWSLAFSPQGNTLVSGDESGVIKIWR
jgi:WD40 repeat protein